QIFSGGFLGLDNIGVFDRSKPLPTGGALEQADGTAWMAFYCGTMLSIALELAVEEPEYEDIASKFFEHFVAIVDAMNAIGESADGLWDEEDGFYYDEIKIEGREIPLRIRSMVGLIPLFAVEILDAELIERLPGFSKRMNWFLENRKDLARHISYMEACHDGKQTRQRLLAMPSRERLTRVLRYLLDENEFLSPYGVRSLSRTHVDQPYVLHVDGMEDKGRAPWQGGDERFARDPHWRELVLFHEYFHGETGRGLGASHQTGWTALVARCLDDLARHNVEAHLQTGGVD